MQCCNQSHWEAWRWHTTLRIVHNAAELQVWVDLAVCSELRYSMLSWLLHCKGCMMNNLFFFEWTYPWFPWELCNFCLWFAFVWTNSKMVQFVESAEDDLRQHTKRVHASLLSAKEFVNFELPGHHKGPNNLGMRPSWVFDRNFFFGRIWAQLSRDILCERQHLKGVVLVNIVSWISRRILAFKFTRYWTLARMQPIFSRTLPNTWRGAFLTKAILWALVGQWSRPCFYEDKMPASAARVTRQLWHLISNPWKEWAEEFMFLEQVENGPGQCSVRPSFSSVVNE